MLLETVEETRNGSHRKEQHPASWLERRFASVLDEAGVTLNGPNPWDPQIHRPRTLRRILFGGTLGAGEAYVDGDWDCLSLDGLATRLLASGVDERWEALSGYSFRKLLARMVNFQSRAFARRNVTAHYDIGNELYTAMLGPTMAYSCGYWRGAKTLEEAQNGKHELICRKLSLEPGMRVLDIGWGWGGFAKYAAELYGVQVVGITLSPAQAKYAEIHCADLPVESTAADRELDRGTVEELAGRMQMRGLDVWLYTRDQWFVPRLGGPHVR